MLLQQPFWWVWFGLFDKTKLNLHKLFNIISFNGNTKFENHFQFQKQIKFFLTNFTNALCKVSEREGEGR